MFPKLDNADCIDSLESDLMSDPGSGVSLTTKLSKIWASLMSLKRENNHYENTVWKFQDFSVMQILREINIG